MIMQEQLISFFILFSFGLFVTKILNETQAENLVQSKQNYELVQYSLSSAK